MADPRDLTTLASVKLLMQKSGALAGAQDGLIAQTITRASVKIMRDTGHEFVPGGPLSLAHTGATRTFEYADGDQMDEVFIDLYPYDLQTSPAPTVEIDTDTSSPTPLTTDQFRVWPQPPSKGIYEALKVLPMLGLVTQAAFRNRQIQITGNWGFPSVPEEVAQACDETVMHWITAYPAQRAAVQTDAFSAPVVPRSYPMTAVDLLDGWWRRGIG